MDTANWLHFHEQLKSGELSDRMEYENALIDLHENDWMGNDAFAIVFALGLVAEEIAMLRRAIERFGP